MSWIFFQILSDLMFTKNSKNLDLVKIILENK